MSTSTVEDLALNLTQEIRIEASLEASFAALLDQMGPANEGPVGVALPMVLEAWPGGRWYRDLGGRDGHHWGHVQAIKRPTLLEVTGPLFMSYAVVSNLQYRLTSTEGGTLLKLTHSALGFIPDEHRTGLASGWTSLLERVRQAARNQ